MQRDTKLAKIYVGALFELRLDEGLLEELYSQCKACVSLLSSDSYVWRFFTSPIIDWQKKAQLIESVLKNKVSKELLAFFAILAKRNRFTELFTIRTLLRKAIDRRLGQRNVSVYSAQELQREAEEKLHQILKRYFAKKLVLQKIIGKELLGGLEIKADDLVLNASLRSRLKGIRRKLLETRIIGAKYYEN